MASVPLLLGAHERSLSPTSILLNGYVEPDPTRVEKPVAIRARPGLKTFKTVGVSANRGMVCKSGLFSDAALLIQGTSVYTLTEGGIATALTGSLAGTGRVDLDAYQDADLNSVAWAATGSALYKITTSGVTLESFPTAGGAGASSVCVLRGYVIASEAGTDQVFVQVPGDTAWQALSFVSAEYAPDKVKAVRPLGEQVWFLGEASAEAWALGGSATPPLEPYGGLVFNIGCKARDAAVSLPSAIIWVDDTNQVRKTEGGAPVAISDPGLSEQIRNTAAGDLSASWCAIDGHVFYILSLGSAATWVYDLSTQKWAKWSSGSYDFFRVGQFAKLGDRVICADLLTALIYTLDPDSRDDAGTTFPLRFSAYAEVLEGSVPCANLALLCEVGNAPRSGQGSDPLVLMRYSGDEGKSWSGWRERSLGVTGASQQRVRWNALGTMKSPFGRIFEFLISDPVGRRISDVRIKAAP